MARKTFAGLCAAAVLFAGASVASPAASQLGDEQEIRALQARLAASVSAGDLDRIMKEYVRGNDLFVFDSDLPRQHSGWASFKQDWGNFVSAAKDVKDEVRDLGITVVGDAAFSHHLSHLVWIGKKDGARHEQLMSMTDAYRKIDGHWLIVLEHFSVPVVDGKAAFVAWPDKHD